MASDWKFASVQFTKTRAARMMRGSVVPFLSSLIVHGANDFLLMDQSAHCLITAIRSVSIKWLSG